MTRETTGTLADFRGMLSELGAVGELVKLYGEVGTDELPVAGERMSYGRWMTRQGIGPYGRERFSPVPLEECDAYVITLASYSDYSGGTVEASNYRALSEDFPETFIEATGGYGTYALVLPLSVPYGEDDTVAYWHRGSSVDVPLVIAELAGLEDYPLYSEDDHSELEQELAWDAWDQYLESDTRRELEELGVSEELDALMPEELRARYYRLTGEADSSPYGESAISVVFPHHDEIVREIARQLGSELA